MAIDVQEILKMDVSDGMRTLGQIREEIGKLRTALLNLDETSKDYSADYAEIAREIYDRQQEINGVMTASKKYTTELSGSYNALTAKLRELKEAWKATDSQDVRDALTAQINDVKAHINAMNESIGNYQHNVGNYTNSIIEAFQKMGISVTSLTAPLKKMGVDIESVDTGIKVIAGTIKTFSGQNLAMLQQMFVSVTASTKAFIAGLTGIKAAIAATGIGALVVLIGVLVAKWDDWFRATDRQNDALDRTKYLIRDLNDDLYDYELLMNWRLEAMKIEGATEEEVLKAQEEELKKEKELAEAKYKEIEANWLLIESEEESAEARKAVTDALNKVNDLNNRIRKNHLDQDLARRRREKKAADDAASAAKKAAQEQAKAFEEAEKAAAKAIEDELAELDKAMQIRNNAAEELKSDKQKEIDSYNKQKAELEKWGLDTEDLTRVHNKKMAEMEADDAKTRLDIQRETLDNAYDLKERELALKRGEGDDQEGSTGVARAMAEADEAAAELERYKAYVEEKIRLNDLEKENYEEGSEERTRIENENANLRMSLKEKEHEVTVKNDKAEKKLIEAKKAAYKSMVQGTSSLLKDLSGAMGESTKMGKGFAIAAATIDTIAAAVSGFRAGMNQWADAGPMAWMAPVQAAINATAALVAGYAQVQKIQNVDTSGTATSGGGSATALAIPNISGLNTPYEYTRQVTTQTEQEELNRDNRVYILESDIQESGNRVRVREAETTF